MKVFTQTNKRGTLMGKVYLSETTKAMKVITITTMQINSVFKCLNSFIENFFRTTAYSNDGYADISLSLQKFSKVSTIYLILN